MEECTVLRRSINDITSRMDINFGSLGRTGRGGRGRGRRGASTASPENVSPKFEKVGALIGSAHTLATNMEPDVPSTLFTGGTTRVSTPGQSFIDFFPSYRRSFRHNVCFQVDILAPNPDDPEDFPALSAGK